MPNVPVYVDNTSHCHINDMYIYEALCDAFPLSEVQKRKPWLRDITYKAIKVTNQTRRVFYKAQKRLDISSTRAAFGIWAKKPWFAKWSPIWAFSNFKNLANLVKSYNTNEFQRAQTHYMINNDRKKNFTKVCQDALHSISQGNPKEMHHAIKLLTSFCDTKKVHKTLGVTDEEGHVAQSIVHEKQIFRDHFAKPKLFFSISNNP